MASPEQPGPRPSAQAPGTGCDAGEPGAGGGDNPAPRWNDRRIEIGLGRLLAGGVLLSAAIVFLGGLLFLERHGRERVDYSVFSGTRPEMRHLRGIVRAALTPSGRGLVQAGLLILIATPVARVAFSLFGFARERDRTYMALTAFVLAVLLFSLLGGIPR